MVSSIRRDVLFAFVLTMTALASAQQITINRIEQMPNAPSQYFMREWKAVARECDPNRNGSKISPEAVGPTLLTSVLLNFTHNIQRERTESKRSNYERACHNLY